LFRASIVGTAIRCAGQWRQDPTVKPILFSIRDISVEGIGLRVERPATELPPTGTVMKDVYLDFGDLGNITTNLEIRTVIPLAGQPLLPAATNDEDGAEGDTAAPAPAVPAMARPGLSGQDPLTHLGAVFVALNGRQEAWLQQVVWRLEKARAAV
jgi:hypothetical protein